MKKELLKLGKEYKKYIACWNKKAREELIKNNAPIPMDEQYKVTFEGFIKWLSYQQVRIEIKK